MKNSYEGHTLEDILICCDGCTDNTLPIVNRYSKIEPHLKVLIHNCRRGKSAALSTLLRNCRSEVLVELGVTERPIDLVKLLNRLNDETVAVVSRGVPSENATITGKIYEVIWALHHKVCLSHPKLSAGCNVFKPLVRQIPSPIINDDTYLQMKLEKFGKIIYEPAAITIVSTPNSLRSYISQRHRWNLGNIQLVRLTGFVPSTHKVSNIAPHLLGIFSKHTFACIFAILLEIMIRIKAQVNAFAFANE
jgi:cellulose synthase/poly-beta-1,6-N-acetylglucosamine synthase-like glycosyltransferase